ncbi:MAG: 1-deoxy-D-xylulose-5-phosphate synthase [Gaiellales bacterium]|nr:1-deoxy-D-xylulose-5-phosphate synthase [Gaiellales bacterium]
MRLIEQIPLPHGLHDLDSVRLQQVADEVRAEIIEVISRTGGHLGASLGVVELTVALHAELESPVDKIVWDVGHQSYAHKILTGRLRAFAGIRTLHGISGFPKREESQHDAFGTGHSSTSVSAAVGLAEGMRSEGRPGRVVAVVGDGALTGGMAFEGLNQAGHLRTPLVVVLNDNEMSIKKNVGALSEYLARLRTDPTLFKMRRDLERLVQQVPGIGERMYAVGGQLKEGVKAALVSGMLFEEMGFTYLGVVNGHDIAAVRANLRRALAVPGPVLLHVRTVKGKGYVPAERAPDRFHGCGAFCIETGRPTAPPAKAVSYTEAFGRALVELARADERIMGITAAMAGGTGLDLLEEALPGRFYDVGIAEQHAVGFAAGLAAAGKRPVVALYSTFLQRAFDQVIHDVCLQNLPVVFAIDRAGLVGEDGPTHHGAFDLSFLRIIPNLTIFCPADEAELQQLLASAFALEAPCAIRYPRGSGIGVPLPYPLRPLTGPWVEVRRSGHDALLLACGTGVRKAEEAAALLGEQGISATVANVRRIKPLPDEAIAELVATHSAVVTVEENALVGGFGSAVLEVMQQRKLYRPLERVGLPDRFVGHGAPAELHRLVGLTGQAIAEQATRLLAVLSGT